MEENNQTNNSQSKLHEIKSSNGKGRFLKSTGVSVKYSQTESTSIAITSQRTMENNVEKEETCKVDSSRNVEIAYDKEIKNFPIMKSGFSRGEKEEKLDVPSSLKRSHLVLESSSTEEVVEDNNCPKRKCERSVFIASEEDTYTAHPKYIHFIQASKQYHQNVNKITNEGLPRKKIFDSWDSLDSIVHVENKKIKQDFEEQKRIFETEGKVDKYGKVTEYLLFHGTSNENMNLIVENNFSIDSLPAERGKVMLFGRGVYFSELPGVSLMYGDKLLLSKVILGKAQRYYPDGHPPPEILDEYDSRVVIKDGLEVVTVVKKASQILPYCIVNIKPDRVNQTGIMQSSSSKLQSKQA